jgi:hypothetical protein
MVHAMVRRSLAAMGAMALAGCAQNSGPHPAFIGLSDLSGDNLLIHSDPPVSEDAPEVLRHIQSNKVLGAMAFQRMTGRTVDPDSLAGRGE